ncbi:MAG: DUF541 domain-containing protein [Bacteroidetes bacterium]|nr:MAG: DUF541 domain-containing protein [Bacteroidota bacterium]
MATPPRALLLAFSLLLALPIMAQDTTSPRTITVSGEGIVRAEPDQAVVRFGVVTQAGDPETARQRNAEAAREAMNAVRALGVPERKLRLETLQLQPRREWDPDTRQWRDQGYEAVRQVVVELDDLERLPALVTEVVQKGANRLDGVSYRLQDEKQARNEALLQAVTEAREKAALMAGALGESLGRVRLINEQSFSVPRPMMRMAAEAVMMADKAAPEPDAYAAGEIEVRATVQVVFELDETPSGG